MAGDDELRSVCVHMVGGSDLLLKRLLVDLPFSSCVFSLELEIQKHTYPKEQKQNIG